MRLPTRRSVRSSPLPTRRRYTLYNRLDWQRRESELREFFRYANAMASHSQRPPRSQHPACIFRVLPPVLDASRRRVALAPIERLPRNLLDDIAQLVVDDWAGQADARSLALVSASVRGPAQRALLRFARLQPVDELVRGFVRALAVDDGRRAYAVRNLRCWTDGPGMGQSRLFNNDADALGEALASMANLATLSLRCDAGTLARVSQVIARRRQGGGPGWARLGRLEIVCWCRATEETPERRAPMQLARFVNHASATLHWLSVTMSGGVVVQDPLRPPRVAALPKLVGWAVGDPHFLQTAIYEAAPELTSFWVGVMGRLTDLSVAAVMKTRSAVVLRGQTMRADDLRRFVTLTRLLIYGTCDRVEFLPWTIKHLKLVVTSLAARLPFMCLPIWLPNLQTLDLAVCDPLLPYPQASQAVQLLTGVLRQCRPRITLRVVESIEDLMALA